MFGRLTPPPRSVVNLLGRSMVALRISWAALMLRVRWTGCVSLLCCCSLVHTACGPSDGSADPPAIELAAADPVRAAETAERSFKPEGSLARKKIVPWLEVNAPGASMLKLVPGTIEALPGQTAFEFMITGLEHWAKVTDTVIVTTRVPSIESFYGRLMKRIPAGLTIIGGFKTSILPGCVGADKGPYGIADPAGWRRIARAVEDVARLTGTNIVVLENEGAMWRFHTGDAPIDFPKLAASLVPLRETQVKLWIYGVQILIDSRRFPDREVQTTRLVKLFADALPGSIFFAGLTGWPQWEKKAGATRRLNALWGLVGRQSMYDIFYVTHDSLMHFSAGRTRPCLGPADVFAEAAKRPAEVVIVYPGVKNWLVVGRAVAEHVHGK
ncbi:MAG: hypothetical protein IID41_11100 [Planctomycetes bacterium]|nr:hypothetical protein [Planctomycetota bacterium]